MELALGGKGRPLTCFKHRKGLPVPSTKKPPTKKNSNDRKGGYITVRIASREKRHYFAWRVKTWDFEKSVPARKESGCRMQEEEDSISIL